MKIGDYVRFKNGKIEKIYSFAEKDNPLFNILINARYHNSSEIEKYGEPIDLIEVGDYVNGHIVYSGGKKHFDYILIWDTEKDYYIKAPLNVVDIKSIVTKEQFESMEYKVVE